MENEKVNETVQPPETTPAADANNKAKKEPPKSAKPKKELTPAEMQKRKKMLILPLFFLIFGAAMWLIFAPSGKKKEEQQKVGFNTDIPLPKEEGIIGDKRDAYEKEALSNKQKEKVRSLQDFAFTLGDEDAEKSGKGNEVISIGDDTYPNVSGKPTPRNRASAIQSSATAYQNINKQLGTWYEQPTTGVDNQAQLALESRIQGLEKQMTEKSEADKQLELIEKSYSIAAKYMPNGQQMQTTDSARNSKEKVIPKAVSGVQKSVVSLLAAPMGNDEFLEQYSKPRNMGFLTASGNEGITDKNTIRACVYQTVTLTNGKEVQLRLLEPMQAGDMVIPQNSIITGACRITGERLDVTISSIQYAENVIPVDLQVYDMDGIRGIFIPGSDELNAAKEIAANMSTSAGTSISITDNAGSQLAADLSKGLIQGASQYLNKKMQTVKVTLKANYRLLLLPKKQ